MVDLSWLIALFGVILVLIIVCDIILTVLHVDTDGVIAGAIFRVVWKAAMRIIRFRPRYRRNVVAMSCPAMIVAAIAVWIGLYILGFTFIYWPYLEYFRASDEWDVLGFVDALYFSGITAAVLGYGDITPLSGALQITAVIQAALGFALLTGIITYLISIVSGVSDRNALSLRLWAETGRSGYGVDAIIRSLKNEEPEDLRLRLQTLLISMHTIHQKMHQFPILDLFYRSKDPIYSPEFMIRSISQMAIATQILSTDKRFKRLTNIAEELGKVAYELMFIIVKQHLSKDLKGHLKNPSPDHIDEEEYKNICKSMTDVLPGLNLMDAAQNGKVLELIFQLRLVLNQLDIFTGWRMDNNYH